MFKNLTNKGLAVALLQLSFGINYFFHGVVRLPKLSKFVAGMQAGFSETLLPELFVTPLAYIIPFAEIAIGVLLIINKFAKQTIIAAFVLMNILVVGSCFAENWANVGLQTTYIGFLFLLLFFLNEKEA
ncbi:hypothetical protein PW52_00185 [Tamlana sedimentorum]|uniref:Methylamine utilisation protein MauE domain-containing protein n=1 Tax=Neotamlana sedimentorum TaxID=1435349 RepID=A0A0D7WDZ3_9FLAO|nr:MauE/DoxX family redox-associated membrane protein [Tamlana sedimentorum]KJD36918.1 hypothetical protein PW52_00185 [Tamlana sedimentorum]